MVDRAGWTPLAAQCAPPASAAPPGAGRLVSQIIPMIQAHHGHHKQMMDKHRAKDKDKAKSKDSDDDND